MSETIKVGDKGAIFHINGKHEVGGWPASVIAIFDGGKALAIAWERPNSNKGPGVIDTNLDGSARSSEWFFRKSEPKYKVYIFADGTVSKLKPEDAKVDITKPYIAVVSVEKKPDGTYGNATVQRVDQTDTDYLKEFKETLKKGLDQFATEQKKVDNIGDLNIAESWFLNKLFRPIDSSAVDEFLNKSKDN